VEILERRWASAKLNKGDILDSDRCVLSSALTSGQISTLLSRGIESKHFSNTPSGDECRQVFDWAAGHARKYGVCPSPQLVKSNFPNWRGEPSSDPLEALVDQFLNDVRRRFFAAKVLELAKAEGNPANWGKLDEIMLDAARDLAAVIPSGRVSRVRAEMQERIDQYEIDKAEGKQSGIMCGIPIFDDLTDGFQQGDIVTVAGYSGRGKSYTAQAFLANALDQGKDALLMSLEMSTKQIMDRFDTMVTNFSHKALRKRELPDEEIENWRRAAQKYQDAKNDLVVVDKVGNCTVDRIYAEINRYKSDITCVDYVQLMKGSRASMQNYEKLVEITNELKSVALATDSTIIMVSQDTRTSAQEGSTESNMGGSVSVYQAADIYIGMMQDEEMRQQKKILMRLIKNRNGSPAESDVLCDPEYGKFLPWERNADFFDKGTV
jgi:replicative DNA helicase